MLNKNKRNTAPTSEFKLGNNLITIANLISENFNEYFVNIGKKLAQNISDPKKSFLSYMTQKLGNENSCAFHLTTSFEIINIVKSMKSGESAGIDEISMNLIKSVIDCIAEPLSVIINLCLTSGIYPDQLKIAKVCPIFKEGSKNELANYRPISIIPSFSKLFEKIISNRLLSYINKFEIFNPAQYGFRKKHSTYMAMLNLYDKVSEAVDKNDFLGSLIFCASFFPILTKYSLKFSTIKLALAIRLLPILNSLVGAMFLLFLLSMLLIIFQVFFWSLLQFFNLR